MDKRQQIREELSRDPAPTPGTLGEVLYARKDARALAEADWAAHVRGVASGSEPDLHALYDRAHRMVFTLALRITCNRETAEEVTLDVFHDVWRRASGYDPANGTVLGWIMNQARSRSLDRVRFEQRAKRMRADDSGEGEEATGADPGDMLDLRQRGAELREALGVLTIGERRAIESAFFAELTHAQIAQRLEEPLGTVKTRIRSGLRKLRRALDAAEEGT